MEFLDYIAIYGALLSSILAYREWSKDKKRIAIFIKYFVFASRSEIIITNIGHRPITLTDISFAERSAGNHVKGIPRNVYTTGEEDWPFPVTLTDGESLVYKIQGPISGQNLIPTVFDSEGTKYAKYRFIQYNDKFGHVI